jgi:hypothetical protein
MFFGVAISVAPLLSTCSCFSRGSQVAFTHNPKSQKSKAIMEAPINGLCKRCTEQIEWKKQYRKYKARSLSGVVLRG